MSRATRLVLHAIVLFLTACDASIASPASDAGPVAESKKSRAPTTTTPSFRRPFSADSPWNRPLTAYASVQFSGSAAVPGTRYSALSTWNGSAWVGIHEARSTDPTVELYFHPDAWRKVRSGEWKRSGNSAEIEAIIRAGMDRNWLGYQANMYSSTLASGFGLPSGFKQRESAYWSLQAKLPAGVVPPPNADGYFAVLQPNGWVLEAMAPILLSTGELVSLFVSFTDPTGSGTGLNSGRRASMVPAYAGVIRDGEIGSGTIDHALCVALGSDALFPQILWPATAMDRSPTDYLGTVPMGALLALPPNLEVAAMGLTTAAGQVIARAAQRYGIYVLDRSAPGIFLLCTEQAARDVPPYSGALEADLDKIREALRLVTVGG